MRSRASALMLAPLLACALAPAAARCRDRPKPANIAPYTAVVDSPSEAATLHEIGFDMTETGYDTVRQLQRRSSRVYLSPEEAATLEARGVETDGRSRSRRRRPKNKALGDSPNPFFNVWRSYSEPGGIADEMRATAAANPDVMKLEQIGTSTLGKPILAIKMTATRATRPTARAPRCCSRRSTTRVSGSRPSRAAACPSGSPSTRTTRRSRRSSARPSCGSCRSRTSTATTSRSPAALGADQVTVRLPQPAAGTTTTASGARRSATTTTTASTATARTASTRTATTRPSAAIDEEGASNSFNERDLPRPVSRSRSRATSPSTACSAASSSTATSTTTPTASCC